MEAAASPSLGQPMTPAVDELVDTHHRAFFSFIPAQFLADLSTIAMDTCADGFDDFERCLMESSLPDATKASLQQVLMQMCVASLEGLHQSALAFEQYELLTSLAVPPELFVRQPLPAAPEPVDTEAEAVLDAELASLRTELAQARGAYRRTKQQLLLADKDASRAAARAAAFRPLGAALASTAAPLLSDAASLGTLAAKLQPLVADAQAAADARRGGGGWPATRDTTGGATDVERRVRAAMADARASLEQLAAANEALSGGA